MKLTGQIMLLGLWLLVYVPAVRAADWWAAQQRRREFDLSALDEDAMLAAIRALESGNNHAAVGALGERTAYQFMRSTWAQYSRVRFGSSSMNEAEVDRVAREHLRAIVSWLRAAHCTGRAEYVFSAWRWGLRGATQHVNRDYCRRGANLYFDNLP